MATFEQMPQTLERLQETVTSLYSEVKELRANQPISEPPINGEELRRRLDISVPTEIRMRKRGELPYLNVSGHYRYNWQEVLKALSNKKKSGGNK